MNLEGFQATITKTINPRDRREGKMDDKVEDIVTINLGAISVVLQKKSVSSHCGMQKPQFGQRTANGRLEQRP